MEFFIWDPSKIQCTIQEHKTIHSGYGEIYVPLLYGLLLGLRRVGVGLASQGFDK